MAGKPELVVTDGEAGLRVKTLRKSYRKKTVIRDVSIDLGRGEVVVLPDPFGPNSATTSPRPRSMLTSRMTVFLR